MKRDIGKIKYFSQDEMKRLMKIITSRRDRAIFLIAYRHGLRASEVGMLRVEDVDLKSNRISIKRLKGSLPGLHVLQPDEVKILKAHLTGAGITAGPLFRGYHRQGIGRRAVDLLMKRYCRLAGLPSDKAHFHTLKHSIATHLLEAQMGIESVRDWLGHKNIENTMIYAKLSNTTLNQTAVVAMAKLPKF